MVVTYPHERGGLIISIILILTMFSTTVAAHGADTFSVVVRGTWMQPYSIEVIQNDTVIIQNVADWNRTVKLDHGGDGNYDGIHDLNHIVENNSEQSLWLDPSNWTAGEYLIEIIENNSVKFTLNMTVLADNHTETGGVLGYEIGGPLDEQSSGDVERSNDSNIIWLVIVFCFGAFLYFALRKRAGDIEDE